MSHNSLLYWRPLWQTRLKNRSVFQNNTFPRTENGCMLHKPLLCGPNCLNIQEHCPDNTKHVPEIPSRCPQGLSRKALGHPKNSGKHPTWYKIPGPYGLPRTSHKTFSEYDLDMGVTWKRVPSDSHGHSIGLFGGNKRNVLWIGVLFLRCDFFWQSKGRKNKPLLTSFFFKSSCWP